MIAVGSRKRKEGISLLIPSQNAERTIALCVRSFVDFADEIIAVDNGSQDNTVAILDDLARLIPKLRFYNAPELVDLYHNRQYAFERSTYSWIVRIDSDYVAYTSGEHDIRHLRSRVLNTRPSIWPIAFGITQVNLIYDFEHTGTPRETRPKGAGRHVGGPVASLAARIVQYYPGMRFQRLGRWEGVRFQRFLRHIQLDEPYWFHCQFKSHMSFFYRSERTNWRELGAYDRYPTLHSYIKDVIRERYGTDSIEEACEVYMRDCFLPYLVRYAPEEYYPYPELIQHEMEKRGNGVSGKQESAGQAA